MPLASSLTTLTIIIGGAIVIVTMHYRSLTKDPIYACDVYLDEGCSHIDSHECNVSTCEILKQHRTQTRKMKNEH